MNDGVKIFGLRSGKSYKMIPALLYYFIVALILVASVYGELKHYKFESLDYILMFSKYIFFGILFLSPLIFLSNFKYRDKLPFFKKHTAGSSLIGLIIVWMFCYFMANVDIMCMSDTWTKSRDAYSKQLQQEREKAIEKNKKENQENNDSTESGTETTGASETTTKTSKGFSYDFEKNIYYI